MIAVPLLLIWAFTGMGFEFGFVEKAWYGALPGDHGPERVLESAESSAPDIGAAAAIAAAQKTAGTDETPTAIDLPAADDPAATYGVWFADGFDPWTGSDYSGDMLVSVERKTGEGMITYGGPEPMAQQLWEDWNFPTHAGWIVGPWVRISLADPRAGPAPARVHRALDVAVQAPAAQAPARLPRHVSEATLDLVVTYLALVAVLAVLAAIGLRCGPAVRTGVIVAEVLLIAPGGARPARHRARPPPARAGDAPGLRRRLGAAAPAARGPRPAASRSRARPAGHGAPTTSSRRWPAASPSSSSCGCTPPAESCASSSPPTPCWPSPPAPARPCSSPRAPARRPSPTPCPPSPRSSTSPWRCRCGARARLAARRDRRASAELAGVLAVGTAERLSATAWPDETVWSGYGAGYGWAPLVLPVAALGAAAPSRRDRHRRGAGRRQQMSSLGCRSSRPTSSTSRRRRRRSQQQRRRARAPPRSGTGIRLGQLGQRGAQEPLAPGRRSSPPPSSSRKRALMPTCRAAWRVQRPMRPPTSSTIATATSSPSSAAASTCGASEAMSRRPSRRLNSRTMPARRPPRRPPAGCGASGRVGGAVAHVRLLDRGERLAAQAVGADRARREAEAEDAAPPRRAHRSPRRCRTSSSRRRAVAAEHRIGPIASFTIATGTPGSARAAAARCTAKSSSQSAPGHAQRRRRSARSRVDAGALQRRERRAVELRDGGLDARRAVEVARAATRRPRRARRRRRATTARVLVLPPSTPRITRPTAPAGRRGAPRRARRRGARPCRRSAPAGWRPAPARRRARSPLQAARAASTWYSASISTRPRTWRGSGGCGSGVIQSAPQRPGTSTTTSSSGRAPRGRGSAR